MEKQTFTNTIYLAILFSIVFMLPGFSCARQLALALVIPIAFLLSYLWKMTGIWFAYPATEILVALLGFVIYKNKCRKGKTYEN